MDNLKRVGYRALLKLKLASPIILSVAASAGTIATAALAIKATPKAVELIKESEKEKGEPLTKIEVVKKTAKTYLPTVITGSATIVCIIGSSVLGLRQNASLIGAVHMLDKSYKNYRQAAKDVYGDDADRRIQAAIAEKKYISANGYSLNGSILTNDEEQLFYDSFSQGYFHSTIAAVVEAESTVNRMLQLRGFVTLNDFYDYLGLPHVHGGDVMGWSLESMYEDNIGWLDFDNSKIEIEEGGLECIMISAMLEPDIDLLEEGYF